MKNEFWALYNWNDMYIWCHKVLDKDLMSNSFWASHPSGYNVIKNVWEIYLVGCPMQILSAKLKHLKVVFCVWNKDVLGDVSLNVQKVLYDLNYVQLQLDDSKYSENPFVEKKRVQIILENALNYQELYLRDKSWIN